MSVQLDFEDRPVLVCGAGGIGTACALAFAGAGARVVAVDVDEAATVALENAAQQQGSALKTVVADLATPETARDAVDQAQAMLGGIDVFVHAVGTNDRRPVLAVDDEQWQRTIDVNLSSAFWTGQAVGRGMCEAAGGRMVFVSSVSGWLAHPDHAPYAASKGGLNQLLRVMAREWAPHGVGVNAVAPGYMETELTRAYLEKPGVRDSLTSLVPAGRLGVVDDVVGTVLYLASDLAKFVTGQVIYIDGGRLLV